MKILSIAFRALGTLNNRDAGNPGRYGDRNFLKKIRDEIMAWDDRLSIFKTGSEISGINEKAGQENVAVSESTPFDGQRLLRAHDGRAFRHCVRASGVALGNQEKRDFIPSEEDIDEAKDLVDYQDIIFEGLLPMKASLNPGRAVLTWEVIVKGQP